MKRQVLKSVSAFCMSVMTLFAASSLVVSCYDDSALWEEMDGVKGQLTELEQKIEEVKAQLETLAARVDGLYTLTFQASSTNELQYSFDGGKTWKGTGINLAEECDAPCECPKVSLVDNGDTVTITVGNQSYTIEKPLEVAFEIRAGRVYFESEGVQTIAIKSTGIDDVTVIATPKGWEAEIDVDGMLVVTAPSYADTEWTYDEDWNEIAPSADYEGVIKVHACSVDGKCMVGKLPVEVSETPMVVKAYAGNYIVTSTSRWSTLFYGISPRETFEADAKVLLDALANNNYSVLDQWEFVAAPTAEGKIADVLGYEPKVGEEYIVWAIDSYAASFNIEDLVIAFYSPVDVAVVEDEAKRNAFDVFVSINVQGADSYYAFAVPDTGDGVDVDYQKENMASNLGGYWCPAKLHTKNYEGSVYSVAEGTQGNAYGTSSPNQDCYLFILPVDGRPVEEYTAADVHSFKFTTSEVVSGGTVNVIAEQVTEFDYYGSQRELDPYTELGVKISVDESAKWSYFYFSWFTEEDYNLLGGDNDLIVAQMTADTWAKNSASEATLPYVSVEEVDPATTMYFVAFFLDENYNYGEVTKLELTSKELVKSDIMLEEPTTNLNDDMLLLNNTTLEVTLTADATASMYKYMLVNSNDYYYDKYYSMDDVAFADEVHFSTSAVEVDPSELVDGKLVIDGHEYNTSYVLAVLPYDEAGNPGKSAMLLFYDCVFQLENVVTDASAFVNEPVITFTIPEFFDGYGVPYIYHEIGSSSYQYSVDYKVTPAAGTEVVAVIIEPVSAAQYGFDVAEATALEKASGLWAKTLPGQSYYTYTFTEEGTAEPRAFYDYSGEVLEPVILVSWKSGDAYYYKEVSLAKEFALMHSIMTTPNNRQLAFTWEELGGAPTIFDFGVTTPGTFAIAYDLEAVYADTLPEEMRGLYMQAYAWSYKIVADDEKSGTIVIESYDHFGDLQSSPVATYTNWDGKTCIVNSEMLYLENVEMEVVEEKIPVYIEQMGGGAL